MNDSRQPTAVVSAAAAEQAVPSAAIQHPQIVFYLTFFRQPASPSLLFPPLIFHLSPPPPEPPVPLALASNDEAIDAARQRDSQAARQRDSATEHPKRARPTRAMGNCISTSSVAGGSQDHHSAVLTRDAERHMREASRKLSTILSRFAYILYRQKSSSHTLSRYAPPTPAASTHRRSSPGPRPRA